MSRLSKKPTSLPQGVSAEYKDFTLSVKGPKGELKRQFKDNADIKIENNEVSVSIKTNSPRVSSVMSGTLVSHIRNMIKGVTDGFSKRLVIEGVGYKAEAQGDKLKLIVGLSHPVMVSIPSGIKVSIEKNVIIVEGMDKEMVGQFAADVCAVKKVEPYKGYGIRYEGAFVRRKQGKRATA
ncbi:MAG: 50S ribosomal protein L6 [Candidatus Campbellbacteria bacterium]|nr:50S ribosomal protein L6 [Candidatus Campbellbacteria bacterium]